MITKVGIVILKKPEWSCPKVFISLNRKMGEKSIDMDFSRFMEILEGELTIKTGMLALEGILKPGIMTQKKVKDAEKAIKESISSAINSVITTATEKILSEMRESVVLPIEEGEV